MLLTTKKLGTLEEAIVETASGSFFGFVVGSIIEGAYSLGSIIDKIYYLTPNQSVQSFDDLSTYCAIAGGLGGFIPQLIKPFIRKS